MRFRQLDCITDLQPGTSLEATRLITDKDGYLRDHFPEFHVLPGALTTEAMLQGCEWLTRKTDDFQHAVVALTEVRNAKFNGMVRPGQTLSVTAEVKKWNEDDASFVTKAFADGEPVASARMTLERYHIMDRWPERDFTDEWLRDEKLKQFQALDPSAEGHQPAPPTSYRWMWIDRFDEFVHGKYCKARKAVCMTAEPVDLYMPYFPSFPPSLVIEGLAQSGGILASEVSGLAERVMLAKVGKATFHCLARPGDVMLYEAELVDVSEDGAMVTAKSTIDGEPHVDAELMFAYIPEEIVAHDLLGPADKFGMMQILRTYEVGRKESGEKLDVSDEFRKSKSVDSKLQ